MKKKNKLSLLALVFLILFSSCAQRRIDYLNQRKDIILSEKKPKEKKIVKFNPDQIDEFKSTDDYLTWYKSLDGPCQLVFKDKKDQKELSQEERVEDFNYLFNQIRDNYPFFGILKRQYGIDFLGNYSRYLNEVKFCKSDQEFQKIMQNIMADLHNDHATIADEEYVKETLEYYSHFWKDPSMYYEFLTMNKESVRDRYNIKGVQSSQIEKEKSKKKSGHKKTSLETLTEDNGENLQTKIIKPGLGLVRVNEMLAEYELSDDMNKLDEFLKNNPNLKALIIDIRQNSGGNIEYWQNYLLPRLIEKKVSVENHMFFRDGMRTKMLLQSEDISYENIENVNLANMDLNHKEDLENFSYYSKDEIEISPLKENKFKGNLYLLVDEGVYSAAEGLANFCKNTKIAKLVGHKTGGDGITLGVINDVLPNSGLVFTYTNTLGYAPDGSINEEEKTNVDIVTESLNESIDTIKKLEKIGE
ncbi:S41 family peptidase [Anaerococcus hydrogenalis]|uniref:Peptidase, S41 family n=1 Tax=Anaerococcus hydrogenalis ACS-025-V-Sch4 TaxID=879306 RepID=F0GYK6_9FIRM|nr:S41 family peptidase [Anaerococcus hydrogenalis]EGC84714.1 peptidase, S41 family [Anaerococcus hydrogenalis ACS-025-V-Sch4]